MISTLRLFKALPIDSKKKKNPSKELLEKTIKKGFVFSPEVVANYSNYNTLIKLVEDEYGLTAEQLNSSFHKSWVKVRDASDEQLFLEQILHYITTYGFEALGIYSEGSVYIPNEKLEIPSIKEDIKLIVIKGYTKKELKKKLLDLLQSGIALKETTMDDIVDIVKFIKLNVKEIDTIVNREVKIRLYDETKTIPKNPTEFLRYLIYKTTEETLLIKNKNLIEKIKEGVKDAKLFKKYEKAYGLENLAQIFYRFKPLFLAFRESKVSRPLINKLRRLAKKHHKPMNLDYLNSITGLIKNSNKINNELLKGELSKVNTFRKVRLAYALRYRTIDTNSILYRVRNGKSYAKEFSFSNKSEAKRVLKLVLDSIAKDIEKNVKGKKIYLPENIIYTLPATEKQFTGNLPAGTYVSVPKDMIVGINWKNVKGNRIDLDLSMQNAGGKIGWDASYRTGGREILFSGDVTDAQGKNGATELFYVKKQLINPYILNLNYYNYKSDVDVPFDIIVAQEEAKEFRSNYMVNPNNVLTIAKSNIDVKQKVLGLLVPTTTGARFYFSETGLGNTRTSSNTDYANQAREYLFNYYNHSIELKDILEKAGAKLVKNKEKCDINLAVEDLEKDTILNLLKGASLA